MLTRVRIRTTTSASSGGSYVDLNYGIDPLEGGYDLIKASGLEPPPSDVNYSRFALVPGGSYQSSSTDARNLVFTVGIKPPPGSGKTVLDMRRDLYHAIPAGQNLLIQFWNDGVYELRIWGYLERIESDYFTKESEFKISIICPNPYFRSTSTISHEGQRPRDIRMVNGGDIPSGLDVTFVVTSPFGNSMTLTNETTGDSISVNRDGWTAGMRVRINTGEGSREVTRRNASGTIQEHLLGNTTITGGWPMLVRGENIIRASSANTEHNWYWDVSYLQYYGGF